MYATAEKENCVNQPNAEHVFELPIAQKRSDVSLGTRNGPNAYVTLAITSQVDNPNMIRS